MEVAVTYLCSNNLMNCPYYTNPERIRGHLENHCMLRSIKLKGSYRFKLQGRITILISMTGFQPEQKCGCKPNRLKYTNLNACTKLRIN